MSKCEFFYGTAAVSPGGSYVPMPRDPTLYAHVAVLRCQTHNCEWIMPDGQQCIIGRIEQLEEQVAQLERPQSNWKRMTQPNEV
jgi:hypothetical protein